MPFELQLLIAFQALSVTAAFFAFVLTKRRGVARWGWTFLVWFATPFVIVTGGLLIAIPAFAGLLWQSNRSYQRTQYPHHRHHHSASPAKQWRGSRCGVESTCGQNSVGVFVGRVSPAARA